MLTIEEVIQSINGISPLHYDDAKIFREQFCEDDISYANSWLYILRSARKDDGTLGYKFHKHGVLAGISYRNGCVYIVNPTGKKRFEVVLNLCDVLAQSVQTPVLVKKIDEALYEQFMQTSLFQSGHPLHEIGVFEDEAFPECVLHMHELFLPTHDLNSKAKKLKRKIRKFSDQSMRFITNWDIHCHGLEKTLSDFFKLSQYSREKYWAYESIITEVINISRERKRYKICSLYNESKMHGLYIGEMLSADCMGLYCALSSRAIEGITEWMDIYFFKKVMQDFHVKTILIGGSETEGVYNYVKKLLPQVPVTPKVPLVYTPK